MGAAPSGDRLSLRPRAVTAVDPSSGSPEAELSAGLVAAGIIWGGTP